MPILGYFVVVGAVLVTLFFVADATLEKGPPPIVTSEQYGLPKSSRPPQVQVLTTAQAPAPDMTSPLVVAAAPKSVSEALAKAEPAAKADAVPKKKRVTRKSPDDYRQNQAWSRDWPRDRYSSGFGRGFFFGRF
jgi:hypothetical protein